MSGPAGTPRDWDAYRALFAPGACFVTYLDDGSLTSFGLEDYIATYGPAFAEAGVDERESHRRTEIHGDLAHRWATCVWRWGSGTKATSGTSRVSMQLARTAAGWRITSLAWQQH